MTAVQLAVMVAYAAPGIEALVEVRLDPGARISDAVAQSGLVARMALDPARLEYAIFGQRARIDTPLRNGDRVEITRPLVADPKRIRRARAAKRDAAGSVGPSGNKH